jgi:hypothetical protein
MLVLLALFLLPAAPTGQAQTSNVFTVDDFIKVAHLEERVEDIYKGMATVWLIASESHPRPFHISHYCLHRLMGVALPVFKDLHLISTLVSVSAKLKGQEDQKIFNEELGERMRHVLGDLNDDLGYQSRIRTTMRTCKDDGAIQQTGTGLKQAIDEASALLTELADRVK